MIKLKVEWGEYPGWVILQVNDPPEGKRISCSWVSDVPTDLLGAALVLSHGDGRVKIGCTDERRGYEVTLIRRSSRVTIRVKSEGKNRYEAEEDFSAVIMQVVSGIEQMMTTKGSPERYEAFWRHRFPATQIAGLKAVFPNET